MERIEFIEKVRFVTPEKFEVLSSTSFVVKHRVLIEDYVKNIIQPTESAFNEIMSRIDRLTEGKGFSLSGCKSCKYIRLINQ